MHYHDFVLKYKSRQKHDKTNHSAMAAYVDKLTRLEQSVGLSRELKDTAEQLQIQAMLTDKLNKL